jgi:FkbM family methyltransferase
MRNLVRSVLQWFGLYAFQIRTIPRGISLHVDLKRLFGDTPPTVIFDVGANIGQTSAVLSSSFASARIWAFEPVSATFDCLVENTRGNPRVARENIALGDRDGTSLMSLGAESGWSRVIDQNEPAVRGAEARTEQVTMLRLDTYCARHNIDRIGILKTDCEGFDLQVLVGAKRMLESGSVDAIYSEVNFRRDGGHGDFFAIESYLTGFGYSFYALYDYSGWEYDVAKEGFTNALFVSRALTRK